MGIKRKIGLPGYSGNKGLNGGGLYREGRGRSHGKNQVKKMKNTRHTLAGRIHGGEPMVRNKRQGGSKGRGRGLKLSRGGLEKEYT